MEHRNIWYPYIKPARLNKLLSKSSIDNKDLELLKDFKYVLLNDRQYCIESGFMIELAVSQIGKAFVFKNKFWLTEIENKLKNNTHDTPNHHRSRRNRHTS